MAKKVFVPTIVLLIVAAMAAVYVFGLHHGRTGEGLAFGKEAVAA